MEVEDNTFDELQRAILFTTSLERAGMKPATIQEIIDNGSFASLVASSANGSHNYLRRLKEDETFALKVDEPVTLKTSLHYLFGYVITSNLARDGYRTVEDLLFVSATDLTACKQIGKLRAHEIRSTLAQKGFAPIGENEVFWDAVIRIYGTLEAAPAVRLIDGRVVYDSPANRQLLEYNDVGTRPLLIGDLATWTRRRLARIQGDPTYNGKRFIEEFLVQRGIREKRKGIVPLEPQ